MPLVQRAKLAIDHWVGNDFSERLTLHAPNYSLHHSGVPARFDDQHQLQGWSLQLNGRLCIFILGAIDYVSPLDKLAESALLEPVFARDGVRNELSAGLVVRIIELGWPVSRQEMFLVLRRQERALVMIKPPREPFRGAVFEVDDCILVS